MNFTAKSSKSQSGKIENRAKYKEKESVDRHPAFSQFVCVVIDNEVPA